MPPGTDLVVSSTVVTSSNGDLPSWFARPVVAGGPASPPFLRTRSQHRGT